MRLTSDYSRVSGALNLQTFRLPNVVILYAVNPAIGDPKQKVMKFQIFPQLLKSPTIKDYATAFPRISQTLATIPEEDFEEATYFDVDFDVTKIRDPAVFQEFVSWTMAVFYDVFNRLNISPLISSSSSRQIFRINHQSIEQDYRPNEILPEDFYA
jgi:hypothetical protein